jgi:hypothetical protein
MFVMARANGSSLQAAGGIRKQPDLQQPAIPACRRAGDLYGGSNILLKARNLVKGLQVGATTLAWVGCPDEVPVACTR